MATVEVSIEIPSLDHGQRIQNQMRSIYINAGQRLARCIRQHMRHLNASRRSPLNESGKSNYFSPQKVLEPVVSDSDVTVAVAIPGISRAYHDIDIYPKEANALAIPLHASAYGISPRENNDRGTYDLFRIKRKGSNEKGNVLYRNGDDGELIPMYALTKHVHQVKDPSLMPTQKQMTDEALAGALAAIKQILAH